MDKGELGAVLLIGASAAELLLYLTGSPDVRMSVLAFSMRAVLLLAILVIFAIAIRLQRAQAD
ncbi:hypothetical protein [Devosia aurantiaca]|uniref:Uncharacterized protein n=1 Tax=Devosia aurantiaca TaxID=2714858 RepID=A0A6M1SHV6_9HYPH|nr:hypothetical protein [Devosia aurantiaca]NGP19047.1 hypothetical protein [Devosia aurantiaca]